MVRRAATLLPFVGAVLVLMGAAPEEEAMLHAFDEALTAMAYVASGVCFFAIVWAGFVLMAEGSDERARRKGKERRHDGRSRPRPGPVGQGRGRAPAERHRPHPLEQDKESPN